MRVPKVTVIIATYNRSEFLKLTLASLFQQTFTDFEAWVIGDACTDETESVVQACHDARIHWHNLPTNSGHQSVPNTEGLRRAQGQYIAYLGHDDLWLPWHLETLVKFLETENADWVHAYCAMIGPTGANWGIGAPNPNNTYAQHSVPPSCWLSRREALTAIGEWRQYTQLSHPVDLDILQRLHRADKRMRFCPELTVLKFPSWEYKAIYQHHGEPPQLRYWRRLAADPRQLQAELYRDIALSLTREYHGGDRHRRGLLRHAFYVGVRELLRCWGEDRWPVSAYLHWAYQRRFKRGRLLRGLKA